MCDQNMEGLIIPDASKPSKARTKMKYLHSSFRIKPG